MKRLSWKPILVGQIYCSPACGGKCKLADHARAFRDAHSTLSKMKTNGWRVHVWENLGWHWSLVNTMCGLSLHVRDRSYWCLLSDSNETGCLHGSANFPDLGYHKDPNKAVKRAIAISAPVFKAWAKAFNNLLSISNHKTT